MEIKNIVSGESSFKGEVGDKGGGILETPSPSSSSSSSKRKIKLETKIIMKT